MSWLSNQLSSIAEKGKVNLIKPVAQTGDKMTRALRNVYKSSGVSQFYNNNKSTILDSAAMAALLASGGLAGGALAPSLGVGAAGLAGAAGLGYSQDEKRRAAQDAANQLDTKNKANKDLQDELKQIGDGRIDPQNPNGPPAYPTNPPIDKQPTEPKIPTLPVLPTTPIRSPAQPIANPITNPTLPAGPEQPGDPRHPTLPVTQPLPGVPVEPVNTVSRDLPIEHLSPGIGENFGQQNPDLANRLNQIVGTGTDQATTSARQLLNANDLAAQLSQQTLNSQADARKKQIQDLSTLLTQQAQTQYERQLPGLYEDLNTRGLLRSSDLGNQMATRQQQSYQDVANQLAQTQLGYNDQQIAGMGNITNQYNSGVGSALNREFSLQDFVNQTNASLKLGQAVTPVQPYNGKSATQTATNAIGTAASVKSLSGK